MLRAQFRIGVPAGIEEDENGTDVMLRGDGEEGVDALRKPSGSCCQSRSWRKTRMVFMPMACAQPSS